MNKIIDDNKTLLSVDLTNRNEKMVFMSTRNNKPKMVTPSFTTYRNKNENIIKYLVEHGAEVNKESNFGCFEYFTTLFIVCYSNDINIIKYLVEHGTEINQN